MTPDIIKKNEDMGLRQAIDRFAEIGTYCKQEGFDDLSQALVASADNISIYSWGQVLMWHRQGSDISRETILSIRRTINRENKLAHVIRTAQSIEDKSPNNPTSTIINDQTEIGILSIVSIQEIDENEFTLRFTGESGRPFTIKVHRGEPSIDQNKLWDGYISVDSDNPI